MKIIITGATGFVGGSLMRYFSQAGHEVVGMGRNLTFKKEIEKFGQFVQADISHSFPKMNADVCIHAAGLASDTANYKQLYRANLKGTQNVHESVSCSKFIFVSSSSVYNFGAKPIKETDPIDLSKLHKYGKSKRLAELHLQENLNPEQSLLILRPRAIYGIGDRLLIPKLINRSARGYFLSPGHLDIQTSLTHVSHLIHACEASMSKNNKFQVYNVADPTIYNLHDVVFDLIELYYDKPIKHIIFPLSIARIIAYLSQAFHIPSSLNTIAVSNLSQSKVLDTSRTFDNLIDSNLVNFNHELPNILNWLREIPTHVIQNETANLAWQNVES